MFQTFANASAAYTKVGIDMDVEIANPHKLILMLYDGALLALALASSHLEKGDKRAMGEEISRACNIIDQGLRNSVDPDKGGELSARLIALYAYMAERLQFASIKANAATINEVVGLLKELRGAWEEIADEPAVLSATGAAA